MYFYRPGKVNCDRGGGVMDGKLVGRLSPNLHLTCKLSVTPRDGPVPVMKVKTVSENGIYRAVDEDADGFSEFTVDVHPGLFTPYFFDLSGGYVQYGVWTIGSDTVCYSDVYRALGGRTYFISLGSEVGTRFRSMFSVEDTSIARSRITGRTIFNANNPALYAWVTYTPEEDGFITISKDNAGKANLKTYVFDLIDLIDGNA